MQYADISQGMCREIVNKFHVSSGKSKGKNIEEYAQELEIPAVSLASDIQPYMFEPTASQHQPENSGTEDNQSRSDDNGQTEDQRVHDTDWYSNSSNLF